VQVVSGLRVHDARGLVDWVGRVRAAPGLLRDHVIQARGGV
jgi:hypothetical protein